MPEPLGLSLRIFDRPPLPGGPPNRQIWRGGATDLATRTVAAHPPRWLALADHPADAPVAAAVADAAPLLEWRLDQIPPGDLPSPTNAGGLILVSMDVAPAQQDEFTDWYNTEHIPLLRRVPGVLAARRFRARGGVSSPGCPAYVALYHVTTVAAYATPTWTAANATPWMLRLRRFQRNRTYFMFPEAVPEA